jgi:hypothetical protein
MWSAASGRAKWGQVPLQVAVLVGAGSARLVSVRVTRTVGSLAAVRVVPVRSSGQAGAVPRAWGDLAACGWASVGCRRAFGGRQRRPWPWRDGAVGSLVVAVVTVAAALSGWPEVRALLGRRPGRIRTCAPGRIRTCAPNLALYEPKPAGRRLAVRCGRRARQDSARRGYRRQG